MWMKLLPWRFIVRRMARRHGFLDPLEVLSHLRRFAQPSEVAEPIELLRAGAIFHARGLLNSRVIQHNLDWVWPYWVERQFDPRDVAFVPRAFSLTHVNLTHRNWTAVGLPQCGATPIVDPHGLVTPFFDGWSIDGWIISDDGHELIPSRLPSVRQHLGFENGLAIETESVVRDLSLRSTVDVQMHEGHPVLRIQYRAFSHRPARLAIALRPYNPEGVSLLHDVTLRENRREWIVNDKAEVRFSIPCKDQVLCNFIEGDAYVALRSPRNSADMGIRCDVGLATAAAIFEIAPNEPCELTVSVPLNHDRTYGSKSIVDSLPETWDAALEDHCRLRIANQKFQFLYDAAIRTVLLHSSEDIYPGPFTYKRFWFRDAAFVLNALLCAGFLRRAELALDKFPERQNPLGYFHSQDGEWDSNGEALWIMRRFCEFAGHPPKPAWEYSIKIGGRWIQNKRMKGDGGTAHAGLLPAGFSAEHLGPNDYYYWDDFWGVAGLRSAAWMLEQLEAAENARELNEHADDFTQAIDESLAKAAERLGRPAMPAAPYRRLDAGAIGSLVADYPLQVIPPADPRLMDTMEYLMTQSLVHGGFFQDMIHSGINPYLTIHMAQVLLRAGDARYYDLMLAVANLASPTGQWPEAIHPRTRGGCMGDGQHVWAAAEWIVMVRNCFVREEGENRLMIGSGIREDWVGDEGFEFGPAPTCFGPVTIKASRMDSAIRLSWEAKWHGASPEIEIAVPGFRRFTAEPGQSETVLQRVSHA